MSKQRDVRLAIRELMSKPEYKHLSYKDILNAVYFSQFGFLKKVMTDPEFNDPSSYKNVAFRYVGSFIAHPKKVDMHTKRRLEQMKNKEDEHSADVQSEG